MKPDQVIYVSPRGWFRLQGDQCQVVEAWPRLEGSAVVVVDFEQSQSGVQACKGKAEYAAAMIEKSVRSEGLVEGPLQVFVHKQLRHSDSSQVLYTAVSLETWQQFQRWSKSQPDHCLVVPIVGLLPSKAPAGPVQVIRVGQQLHAYAESDGRMHYASATALGSDSDDLLAPMRTLLAQLRSSGWVSNKQGILWAVSLSDDLAVEQELAGKLSQLSAQQVRLNPHATLQAGGSAKKLSALLGLFESVGLKAVQAPMVAKLAWQSEAYVLPLAAMVSVVALGLGGLAHFSGNRIAQEKQATKALQAEADSLKMRLSIANQSAVSPATEASMALTQQLGHAAIYDPVQMLNSVRLAAGPLVRIQQLQLLKADGANKARFRVDGVVSNGANDELSRFLADMKSRGWQADPADPKDSAVGSFAYHLSPLVQDKRI